MSLFDQDYLNAPPAATRIGFTGTARGMTDTQRQALRSTLLHPSWRRPVEFHHGDCVGADEEAHAIAVELGFRVVIHPPLNPSKRAWCKTTSDGFVLPAKEYLPRNHDIVDMCDYLIAAPRQDTEQRRSGTWATWRYADKQAKKGLLIPPGGFQAHVPMY